MYIMYHQHSMSKPSALYHMYTLCTSSPFGHRHFETFLPNNAVCRMAYLLLIVKHCLPDLSHHLLITLIEPVVNDGARLRGNAPGPDEAVFQGIVTQIGNHPVLAAECAYHHHEKQVIECEDDEHCHMAAVEQPLEEPSDRLAGGMLTNLPFQPVTFSPHYCNLLLKPLVPFNHVTDQQPVFRQWYHILGTSILLLFQNCAHYSFKVMTAGHVFLKGILLFENVSHHQFQSAVIGFCHVIFSVCIVFCSCPFPCHGHQRDLPTGRLHHLRLSPVRPTVWRR